MKEEIRVVPKTWGQEIYLVNCNEYGAKLLCVDKGAVCSTHAHKTKKETFISLGGAVVLTIAKKTYMLNPFARPKTILPGQYHSFRAICASTLLEVSTHHEESDVVRANQSQQGTSHGGWPCFFLLEAK